MKMRQTVARILAILGALLAALPILFMLVTSLGSIGSPGGPRLDWLIPAELSPAVLLGAVLLLIAAFLARRRRVLVACLIAAGAAMIGGGMMLAEVSGLASGAVEADASPYTGVLFGMIWAYNVLTAALAASGVLLVVDLSRHPEDESVSPAGPAAPAA